MDGDTSSILTQAIWCSKRVANGMYWLEWEVEYYHKAIVELTVLIVGIRVQKLVAFRIVRLLFKPKQKAPRSFSACAVVPPFLPGRSIALASAALKCLST